MRGTEYHPEKQKNRLGESFSGSNHTVDQNSQICRNFGSNQSTAVHNTGTRPVAGKTYHAKNAVVENAYGSSRNPLDVRTYGG